MTTSQKGTSKLKLTLFIIFRKNYNKIVAQEIRKS